MRARRLDKRGFTLVEMMIVVAIIGVLAAIAMPQLARMGMRAREATTKQNMHLVQTAIEDFAVLSTGRYPDDGVDVCDDGRTVRELCPGAIYPQNPYTNLENTVVWDVNPNTANQGEIGVNPATPSSYMVRGSGGTGSLLATTLTTGS